MNCSRSSTLVRPLAENDLKRFMLVHWIRYFLRIVRGSENEHLVVGVLGRTSSISGNFLEFVEISPVPVTYSFIYSKTFRIGHIKSVKCSVLISGI